MNITKQEKINLIKDIMLKKQEAIVLLEKSLEPDKEYHIELLRHDIIIAEEIIQDLIIVIKQKNAYLTGNKEIDLTIIENQILVSRNWFQYKDIINIPKEMMKEIEKILELYNNMFISSSDVYNKILDWLYYYYTKKMDIQEIKNRFNHVHNETEDITLNKKIIKVDFRPNSK